MKNQFSAIQNENVCTNYAMQSTSIMICVCTIMNYDTSMSSQSYLLVKT